MTGLAVVERSGNLPGELTRFIGRRAELAGVKQLLEQGRLVTLYGVGGVGKSRLALRAGADLAGSFPDGVWLVELSSLHDPKLLARTTAEALLVPDQATGDPVQLLAEHLADRRLLLILDTCEHLVDACATLAEALLRAAPQVHILATSREPLAVVGEQSLFVPPMDMPDPAKPAADCDSMALFADRAESAVPGFALTEDNGARVARLCRRLDGIPLAIELAAVRLRAMSLEQLEARLSDRFRLLGTNRTRQGRHRTLRATVEWSHELCTATERLLWARLSVFPGGFDLEAAERVCAVDGMDRGLLIDTLSRLVDKSIVLFAADEGRYHMLDTIREYGAERLGELGADEEYRRRHRDYYLTVVERACAAGLTPEQLDWLVRLRTEHANLRVALDYCYGTPGQQSHGVRMTLALRHYWLTLGLFSEGRRWHDRALAVAGTDAWIIYGAAVLALQQGDFATCDPLLERAAALVDELDDRDLRAHVTEARAIKHFYAGDLGEAQELFERALGEYQQIGHSDAFSMVCYARLASVHCLTGELDRAISLSEACLTMSRNCGDQWARSTALWTRGAARWLSGDIDLAIEDTLECLRIKESLGDLHTIAMSIDLLMVCAVAQEEFVRAAVLSGAGDALWKTLHAPIQQGPHYTEIRRDAAATARTHLGDARFEDAHRRGTAMSVPEVIALARNEPAVPADHPLTKREREIAALVAEGLSNREIAERLVVAKRTVDSHIEHIFTKLGITTRTQLAVWTTTRD